MSSLDKWKMVFGFTLLFMLCGLAYIIAVENVEEKSSFGLPIILTVLTVLGTKWAEHMFGSKE